MAHRKKYTSQKTKTGKINYLVLERDEGGIYGKFASKSAAHRRADRLNKQSSADFYVKATKPFGSRKSQQRKK